VKQTEDIKKRNQNIYSLENEVKVLLTEDKIKIHQADKPRIIHLSMQDC